jgi:hypothetical protein
MTTGRRKEVTRPDVSDLAAGLAARFRNQSETPHTDVTPASHKPPPDSGPEPKPDAGPPVVVEEALPPPVATPDPDQEPMPTARAKSRHRVDRTNAARTEPVGMTRRSLYTTTTTFERLDAAVARVQKATGGLVPKHEALTYLINAGIAQTDTVVTQLTQQIAARLSAGDDMAHTDV